MKITMPSDLQAAVERMLQRDADVGGRDVAVARDEPVPEEPLHGGWVGIYRQRLALPPRALGMGGGSRRQSIGLVLILQASHAASGQECALELDDLLRRVLAVITGDPTLDGLAQTLGDEFSVDYKLYDKSSSLYVQEALVQFSAII